MNENERRELVLCRHLNIETSWPGNVDENDAALIDALESKSTEFLAALHELVIPREALDTEAATRLAYDRVARRSPESAVLLSSFGRRGDLDLATRELHDELAQCLIGVPNPRHALDFGCGLGRHTSFLEARSDWVLSVDLSFELLRLAAGASRVQASSLGFLRPGCKFGLILAGDVLPALAHLPGGRREEVLAELFARLEPAGVLLIVNYDYEQTADASARLITRACQGATVQWRSIEQTLWRGVMFVVRAQ